MWDWIGQNLSRFRIHLSEMTLHVSIQDREVHWMVMISTQSLHCKTIRNALLIAKLPGVLEIALSNKETGRPTSPILLNAKNQHLLAATETAWGGDTEGGSGKGWWYYFDPSKGLTQTIWAGQIINVGNVTVSGCSDGKATITITLTDGWELQDVVRMVSCPEPVKIQGYYEIPDERPPAGKFETLQR